MLIKAQSTSLFEVKSHRTSYGYMLESPERDLGTRRCLSSPVCGPLKCLTPQTTRGYRNTSIYTETISSPAEFSSQLMIFDLSHELKPKLNIPLESLLAQYQALNVLDLDEQPEIEPFRIEESLKNCARLLRLLKFEMVDLDNRYADIDRKTPPSPAKTDLKFQEFGEPTEGQLDMLSAFEISDLYPDSYMYSADYRIRAGIKFSPVLVEDYRDQALRHIRDYRIAS